MHAFCSVDQFGQSLQSTLHINIIQMYIKVYSCLCTFVTLVLSNLRDIFGWFLLPKFQYQKEYSYICQTVDCRQVLALPLTEMRKECLCPRCCKVELNVSLTFWRIDMIQLGLSNSRHLCNFWKIDATQLGLSNCGMTLNRVKILFQKPELHRNNYHWRQKFRWSHHQLSNSPEAESYKMISDAMVETEISQK